MYMYRPLGVPHAIRATRVSHLPPDTPGADFLCTLSGQIVTHFASSVCPLRNPLRTHTSNKKTAEFRGRHTNEKRLRIRATRSESDGWRTSVPAEASEKEKVSIGILISKCREVRERGAHFCLARSVNLRTCGRAHHSVWEN